MMGVDLGPKAFCWLLLLGALSGAFSIFATRRWTPPAQLRGAINRMIAHLFEFRLFADEPLLVWRAQRKLFAANIHLLRLLVIPLLIVSIPIALSLIVMDGFFSNAPLRPGEPAVVTAQFDSFPVQAALRPVRGIQIDAPSVRVRHDSRISWRIMPNENLAGTLQIAWHGRVFGKTVTVGSGPSWISEVRTNSWLGFLLHPTELPFQDALGTRISIQYPKAVIFGYSWVVWYSAGALAGSLLAVIPLPR